MIDKIFKVLDKSNNGHLYTNKRYLNSIFILVMYIKYMCENNIDELSFNNINNDNVYDYIKILCKKYNSIRSDLKIDIETIFDITKDVSSLDLIEELFKRNENKLGISLLNKNLRKACALFSDDISAYDRYGNTIYYNKTYNGNISYKLLDEMFGVSNKYIELSRNEKIVINDDVDLVYINDYYKSYDLTTKRIYDNDNNEICLLTNELLSRGIDVVLKSKYRCISLIDVTYFYSQLDKIILGNESSNDDSMIMFKAYKSSEDISIILYDKDYITGIDKLKEVIKDNKENSNYLIKVTYHDLLNNGCRIGFKLYSNEINKEKNKTIQQIIDDNERLMSELKILDHIIETETDYLINK